MRISRFLSSSMILGATVAVSTTAWSQEAAPTAEPAPAEPAAEPAPAEPATEPMAEAPAAEAPAEEEASGPSSWFRIDSDGLGLQLWAGTTNSIGSLDIASDIYVGFAGTSFGEFDIGPTFSAADGKLILTPMMGVSFDWTARELASIVPQFYTIYAGDKLYFESWIQVFLNSPSDYLGGANTLYSRDFLLYNATDDFHIGAGVEPGIGLNTAGKAGGKTLYSLPIGPVVQYNAMGDWKGTISMFLGVETQDPGKFGDNLVGRLTYIHYF